MSEVLPENFSASEAAQILQSSDNVVTIVYISQTGIDKKQNTLLRKSARLGQGPNDDAPILLFSNKKVQLFCCIIIFHSFL